MRSGPSSAPDLGERGMLVHARYVVPVRPRNVVYKNYSVLLHDDRIADLLPRTKAELT